jgi:hypothetical protein
MPLTVQTADGPLEISDALIRAIARRADFVAALVAQALRIALDIPELPPGHVRQVHVPPGFLLELGAVLVLDMWERQGITAHLQVGLPNSTDADADLARRFSEDATQFERIENSTLNRRVIQFWAENFAWDGIETFGTDLLLNAAEEDAFVDAAARFLYENRNALKALLPKENHE